MIFDFEEWVVIDLELEIENIQVFLPKLMVMILSHFLVQFCVVEDVEIVVQYSSTLKNIS